MTAVEYEAELALEATPQRVEHLRRYLNRLAAYLADEMADRRHPIGEFVKSRAMREVHVSDVAEFLQHVERSVHRTRMDIGDELDQAVGADRSGLRSEGLDDPPTRSPDPAVTGSEQVNGVVVHAAPRALVNAGWRRDASVSHQLGPIGG
jgi:hypothetical protein